MRRLLAFSVGSFAIAMAGTARADDTATLAEEPAEAPPLVVAADTAPPPPPVVSPPPPPRRLDLGECTFLSDRSCDLSLVAELGMGGGQSLSNLGLKDFGHFFLEGGLLIPTRGARDLHIGPVFELAVEVQQVTVAWVASPRVRARYFAGGSEMVLEGSFGPAFQRFAYHDGLETGTRAGVATDFSFGYRGVAGPWAQLSALGDLGGNDRTDLRWVAGIRANLAGWAFALSGGRGL